MILTSEPVRHQNAFSKGAGRLECSACPGIRRNPWRRGADVSSNSSARLSAGSRQQGQRLPPTSLARLRTDPIRQASRGKCGVSRFLTAVSVWNEAMLSRLWAGRTPKRHSTQATWRHSSPPRTVDFRCVSATSAGKVTRFMPSRVTSAFRPSTSIFAGLEFL